MKDNTEEYTKYGSEKDPKQQNMTILVQKCINAPMIHPIRQESQTPGPQTGTGPWPVRNWASRR